MRPIIRSSNRRRGIATLWTVLTIIIMFIFVAFAIDILWAVFVGYQLGAGADSAALAGTMDVRRNQNDARTQAQALAELNAAAGDGISLFNNGGTAVDGDIVIGRYRRADRSFIPTTFRPNAVKVVARRNAGASDGPAPTIFGSMFGLETFNIERYAIAIIGGDLGPGVIALNTTDPCTLDLRGNIEFGVQGGAIIVNSNNNTAACHSGQPSLDAGDLLVQGELDKGFESQVDSEAEIFTGADPVPDPLQSLPEPNVPSVNHGSVKISGNGLEVVTLQPGYYSGIEITNSDAVVTMESGLYYIDGEFKYNGGTVDATSGVMMFIGPNGNIDIAGNGTFEMVGMSPISYPNGPTIPSDLVNVQVPIFQSRSNTTKADINGTSDWMMEGTLYLPSAELEIEGTPGTFANGLIADSIQLRGTNDLQIDITDQFPKVPRFVFLVE